MNNSESEWNYFDLWNAEIIETAINEFFIADILHVSMGRQDSYTVDKIEVFSKVKPLLGQTDFKIWNENFKKTLEVNKIGVYRTGYASS